MNLNVFFLRGSFFGEPPPYPFELGAGLITRNLSVQMGPDYRLQHERGLGV